MTGLPDLPPIESLTVSRAEVRQVLLRLRRPHLAAHGEVVERPTVIVRIDLEGGGTGWGECPALPGAAYTDEDAAGTFSRLRDEILPALLEGRVPQPGTGPMASGAVHDALLDAALRGAGRSLVDALGSDRLEVAGRSVVSADGLADLVDVVALRVREGYRRIGLKVRPGWLLDPLTVLRSTWPDLGISIDGNGSLDQLDEAAWRQVDALALDSIEQPCPPNDLSGSARVAGLVGCPVALDESIVTVGDLDAVVAAGAGRMVNLKPARVGGLVRAVHLAGAAVDRGLVVFVGGMLESGVGRATALAFASMDVCQEATHLGPSEHYWVADLTEPIASGRPGHIAVPHGPGIGVTPDPVRLENLTVGVASVEA